MPSHSRVNKTIAPTQRTAAEVVNNEFSDDAASFCEVGIKGITKAADL